MTTQTPAARETPPFPKPRWLAELSMSLASNPQIILTGNVRDYHLLDHDCDAPDVIDTVTAIRLELQARGLRTAFVYSPVAGMRAFCPEEDQDRAREMFNGLPRNEQEQIRALLTDQFMWAEPSVVKPVLGSVMSQIARGLVSCGLILDHASWLTAGSERGQSGSDAGTEAPEALRRASQLCATQIPFLRGRSVALYNPFVWLVRQPGELPSWLTGTPGMRVISIERPGLDIRRSYAELVLEQWPAFQELPEGSRTMIRDRFASTTEGATLRELRNIVNLAKDQCLGPSELDTAQFAYRAGVTQSEWEKPTLRARIAGKEQCQGALRGSGLAGQSQAVLKAADIVQRAALGLAGSEAAANPNRPKGVLFFTGPTGVGKTMLAKSIAELVVGRMDNYIRFDMSEYSQEHSEARLVGAPPGYVGHSAGGQLTEAVRQRPFSLLLFDEIEKAHPLILDKFLQILDEGRLTDGSGTTVNFSETLIVFTSNLGITDIYRDQAGNLAAIPRITYGERFAAPGVEGLSFAVMEERVREAVREYFKVRIQRPELLNRIGEGNIVVFDFVSHHNAADILDTAVRNVAATVERKLGIRLNLSDQARRQLLGAVMVEKVLEMGGRGINSAVEENLVNPLSRALADEIGPTGVLDFPAATVTGIAIDPITNERTLTLAIS